VVEIRSAKKSEGWFFHAITAEEWLLKMKFRVTRNTFKREELIERLRLKPLNDMPELPLYGTQPRVRCRNLAGPWQEVELRVHSYDEIDRPEFWAFVDQAVAGFERFTRRVQQNPEDLMPWKALGEKWHFTRKGFAGGGRPDWDTEVLQRVLELLQETAPRGQFLWGNKQVVPVMLPGRREPWAAVQTKKCDAVWLTLIGPKGRFPLGRLTELGHQPELDAERGEADHIKLKFRTTADLDRGNLRAFLAEHLGAVTAG
jgi:excinuclease ABC subunit A